ncbi:MAG: RIP metalloprotease RseP, partial [Candidatus Binatia bacterium]
VAQVGGIIPDAPAQKAGLELGDKVLSVGGVPVETWKDLAEQIQQSQGQETPIVVQKEKSEQPVELKVTPELRQDPTGESKYAIGITPVAQSQAVSFGQAIKLGVQETWAWTKMIGWSLWMLVTGQASPKELGGPILIAQVAHQQAMLGLAYLLRFTAIINVNLAVFNLLPIPLLDGGHLLFFLIELVLGRPLSVRSREMAWRVGFFLILTLIVFVFYNDIARLVG